MDQTKLSRRLKVDIIFIAVCLAVVYFAVLPTCGRTIAQQNPEFAYCFWPWLAFLWITAAPLYAALIFCWKIAANIGRDQTFTKENAASCKWVSNLAVLDSAYFFIGNIVLWFLNMNHPGIVLGSLLVVFAGAAIAIAFAALSNLVSRAAALQEQSDLTI